MTMKYEVKYTLQREIIVTIEVADNELNGQFDKLGEITSDKDFNNEFDPRWKIEQIAYDDFSSYNDNVVEDVDNEAIVNRAIRRVNTND